MGGSGVTYVFSLPNLFYFNLIHTSKKYMNFNFFPKYCFQVSTNDIIIVYRTNYIICYLVIFVPKLKK